MRLADTSRSRRAQARKARTRRSAGAAPRFVLTLFACSPGLPQLRLRAVQHPLGLDAAEALHRRLSVRLEMALRLFALRFPFGVPAVQRPGARPSAQARRRRRLPPPGDNDDLDQARDRPARRHDRGARRAADPQRPGGPARQARRLRNAVSPNSPCRWSRRDAVRRDRASGRPVCLYPAFRETLPGGRSYNVLDQVDDGPADNFPASQRARRAMSS